MGGRGSSSASGKIGQRQQLAMMEIRALQDGIRRERERLGVSNSDGINTFISSGSRDLAAQRRIGNYEARIERLRRENGL